MGTAGGRRERKKLATREALSAAALRLAREHGPQNVRVDDIAEAAGVSPRTYNNYFSSREQAIMVALAAERGARVAAALRKRPTDEPLEHAVVGALIEQYSDDGEPDRDTLALITSAPALRAEFLDTIAAIERPLAEAIAARTRADGQGELGPEVLAAAVSGAARIAAERWLQPEPDTKFSVMLNDALTWIAPALRAADGFQRAPTYSHEKLGELAVATGDSTTAAQHHQAALTIAERLAAADPGNA